MSSRSRRARWALLVIPLALLVFFLRNGNVGEVTDKSAARVLSDGFLAMSNSTAGFSVDRAQADCLGAGLVTEFGTAKLVKMGFLVKGKSSAQGTAATGDLSADDAARAVDVFDGCVDLPALIQQEILAGSGASMNKKTRKCVRRLVNDRLARAMLTDQFVGGTTGRTRFERRLASCAKTG